MADYEKKEPPLLEGEIMKPGENIPTMQQSGADYSVSMSFLERLRERSQTKLLREKRNKAEEMEGLLKALAGGAKAGVELEVQREVSNNIETVKGIARTDIEIEFEKKKRKLQEAKRATVMLTKKQDAEEAELERRKRNAERDKNKKQREQRSFGDDIKSMLRHGAHGKWRAEAEELIAEFIAEKGGEENLTKEEEQNIASARLSATRRDESKS